MRIFSLLLAVTLLIGCTDNPMSPAETPDPSTRVADAGTNQFKFRNAHLMEKALVPGKAGKFGNSHSLQIVFAIDKQRLIERYGIVERFAVLERYKIVERYQILERYEYANVFDGFAITIDDSLGLSEYDDFLAELAADDEILWFEPDFSVTMPDADEEDGEDGQVVPWSVATVGGQTSWTVSGDGIGSVDVDVYVLDTGVALADAGDPNDDLNLVESVDFRETENDPTDEDGHGTHIAGIIGAVDDSGGLVGIAPGARIHNFKVLDDDGSTDVSVVIAAVEEITARKLADPAKPIVVNMSIGENIETPEYSALDYAVEASIDAGVVYVIAAGNHGQDASLVTPAKVDRAITVGSYNILGLFSSFSNHGPLVDILAPGEGVMSLAPASSTPVSMSGTSMSTAHASGAAALYLAQNPSASPASVEAHLLSNAMDFVVGAPAGTTTSSLWVGGSSVSVAVQLSGDINDAEQQDSDMDLDSSDLELGFEGSSAQTVGMRFTGVNVPQGATITSAAIQFTVDETDSDNTSLTFRGEASDNAADYGSGLITTRPTTSASASWAPEPWTTVGEAGADQRTPDLAALVQEIVSRPGWTLGNALAITVSGTGERTAESYKGSSGQAPVLHVEYQVGGIAPPVAPPVVSPPLTPPVTNPGSLEARVSSDHDDAEEEEDGDIDLGSSDLELADEGSNRQTIGIRFQDLGIPAGAVITSASIQFTVDETDDGSVNLAIRAQAADDAWQFSSADNDITDRARTLASVAWAPGEWDSVGEAGSDQETPDLSALIQEVVSRPGWNPGSSIAFIIDGSGERTAESHDGSVSKAPLLRVTWQ